MNGSPEPTDRERVLRRLAGSRPRSLFLRWSGAAFAALVVHAWLTGGFALEDFLAARRIANVERFAGELKPYPLQSQDWDGEVALHWAAELMATRGWSAAATTLAISILAIVLAGVGGALATLPATRTFATAEPYVPDAAAPSVARRTAWNASVWIARAVLIFARAVPEYVWAFLLIAVIGPNVWAAVLALAVHNAGILGKLNAEVVENLPPETLTGLRALGARRRHIAIAGIVPAVMPRFLLLFFYRWETCVREATVLGMLGIVSLGWFIQDARARQQYDVMLALILLGAALVLAGDVASALARDRIRESS